MVVEDDNDHQEHPDKLKLLGKSYNPNRLIDSKRAESLHTNLANVLTIFNLLDDMEAETESGQTFMKFILPFIMYGKIERNDNSTHLSPVEIIEKHLLSDVEKHTRTKLVANILANLTDTGYQNLFDLIMEKLDINKLEEMLDKLETEENPDDKPCVGFLEFWINCLNNEEFREKVSHFGTGLKLYEKVTAINMKDPTKLTLEVKKLVIRLIIKVTIGYPENEKVLAQKIIKDLEYLEKKRDIGFVNNILTPLLKAENKTPVSFDFYDENSQSYYTFGGAIEQCSESPRKDNFLSKPEFACISKHFAETIDREYNSRKLLTSKWKSIYSVGDKATLTDYETMLTRISNKPYIFLIIEGSSKNLNDTCLFGVYNRNALYKKGDKYSIKTSPDNFCFSILGKTESASFNLDTSTEILKFDTEGKDREVNVANGFLKISFPTEKVDAQGDIGKEAQNLKVSQGYAPIPDFKLEKFEVWTLDGMQDMKDTLQDASKDSNPVEPLYAALKDKFEESKALTFYRENCFLCK